MARLLGVPERGMARIAELDAAVARLRAVASRQMLRVLPMARRGWVPGGQSVISDLMRLAGLSMSARKPVRVPGASSRSRKSSCCGLT